MKKSTQSRENESFLKWIFSCFKGVAPECILDNGAGRHIKVAWHVSLRPPRISLVYIKAWAFFYIRFYGWSVKLYWRGVDQHSTGHNKQPDQLYAKEMLHCVRQMMVTPNTDWFSVKLHILEWPFIVASLISILIDMPHLWGGWIISAKEKCSLTQS